MTQPPRLLILHANPAAAEQWADELRRAGLDCDWQRAGSEAEFLAALAAPPDLILAHHTGAGFDGLAALAQARARGLEAPVILVAEAPDPALAQQALEQGAADYVEVGHLARLGLAAANALRLRALAAAKQSAEQALAQRDARFRALIEHSSDGLALFDAEWRLIYVSPGLARLAGFTPDEMAGQDPIISIHPDDRAAIVARRQAVLAEPGATHTLVFRGRRRDGSWRWLESQTQNLLHVPAVGAIVAHYQDITERRQAEDALRASEERNRLISELTTDFALAVRLDPGRAPQVEWATESLPRLTGYTLEELIAGRWRDVLLPEDLARAEDIGAALTSGQTASRTVRLRARGGETRWVQIFTRPAPAAPGGQPRAYLAVQDITDRKQSEEAARRRASAFVALYESAHDLAQTHELPGLLHTLVGRALDLLQAPVAGLYLLDPLRGDLELVFTTGYPVPAGRRLALGEGVAGRVAATRQVVNVADYSTWPHRALKYTDVPFAAVVGVPMLFQGEVVGVLVVDELRPSTRRFSEADEQLLLLFAGLAAGAVHNARLLAVTEQRLEYFEALHHIDMAISGSLDLRVTLMVLLDQLRTKLRVDAAAVLVLNPARQAFEYAVGRGFRTRAVEQAWARTVPALSPTAITPAPAALMRDEDFSAYRGLPLVAKGQPKGLLAVFQRGPLAVAPEAESFLEALASQAAIAVDNASLFERLQRGNTELIQAYDATIEGWSRLLDRRDGWPPGHAGRLADRAVDLAREAGLDQEALGHLRRGALLHDIGLLLLPDAILRKPGPLDEAEWAEVRRHPQYAQELLQPIAFLRPALEVPYAHHERWDGSGYPRGLTRTEIPLAARLFAVVDVWDALTSPRPHRAAWTQAHARDYLAEQAGAHFDPAIVEAFWRLKEPD